MQRRVHARAEAAGTGTADALGERYWEAIRGGSSRDAQAVVEDGRRAGLSATDILAGVVQPAMYRIGHEWEGGKLSVADEHLATAVTQRVLGVLYPSHFVRPPASRERLLLACVQGEQHDIGVRMVADVIEGAGFEVVFLGANVPRADLMQAIERHSPKLVGLSATSPPSEAELVETVAEIRALHPDVTVLVGGARVAALLRGDEEVRFAEDVTEAVRAVEAALGG